MIGKMVAFQIQNLLVAYKERFDKDNFVKNLLLDNLLLVDIYSRAKKLHIQTDAHRVVMILDAGSVRDNNILELVRAQFGTTGKDFVTAVDENAVIIVKELERRRRWRAVCKKKEWKPYISLTERSSMKSRK